MKNATVMYQQGYRDRLDPNHYKIFTFCSHLSGRAVGHAGVTFERVVGHALLDQELV